MDEDDGQTREDIITDDIDKLIKSPDEEQNRPNVPLPVSLLRSDTSSTKERFKSLDNDNIEEPVGIEDDGPDDASDPIKPTAITLARPPR